MLSKFTMKAIYFLLGFLDIKRKTLQDLILKSRKSRFVNVLEIPISLPEAIFTIDDVIPEPKRELSFEQDDLV